MQLKKEWSAPEAQAEWLSERCPKCGETVVSKCYYVGGKGYLIVRACEAAQGETPQCDYHQVLC